MLRLLIATLPDTLPAEARETLGAVNVYQDLSDRFSIHSIARARKRWPSAHLSFVVGSDLLPQLPKWYQAEKIFDQVEILVFPRPGYPVEGPALSALRQLATVRIADPAFHHDVSSSHFRSVWCAQDSMNADLASDPAASDKAPAETTQATEQIPAVIRDYITEHNLYPCLQATHPPTPREKVSTLR